MLKLAQCVFRLEARKGHLKWKVTELVRAAGVSRPLVYRYFGSNKKEILLTAVRVFTDELYGFSGSYGQLSFREGLKKARKYLIENQDAIVFYQRWRSHDSWLLDEFVQIESRFQQGLKKTLPKGGEGWILVAHAFLHGIVTAPFLSPEQASRAWALIEEVSTK